jgi:hypothetical protein
MDLDHNMTL